MYRPREVLYCFLYRAQNMMVNQEREKPTVRVTVGFLVLLSRPSYGLKEQDELLRARAKTVHHRLIRFMLQHNHD